MAETLWVPDGQTHILPIWACPPTTHLSHHTSTPHCSNVGPMCDWLGGYRMGMPLCFPSGLFLGYMGPRQPKQNPDGAQIFCYLGYNGVQDFGTLSLVPRQQVKN